jgi:hypothetical protein
MRREVPIVTAEGPVASPSVGAAVLREACSAP